MSNKSYAQLTDAQRIEADKHHHLLGKKIDEPLFWFAGERVMSVNSIAHRGGLEGDWGDFCYECHAATPKGQQHEGCTGRYVYPIKSKEQIDELLALKTLREQWNAAG